MGTRCPAVLMFAIWIGMSGLSRCGESPAPPAAPTLGLPSHLIALDSDQGQRLLWECRAREDFIPLSLYFETQQSLATCSAATGAMVLNSLGLPRPPTRSYGPFRLFTQDNFFTPAVCRVVSRDEVSRSGMSLRQFADAMSTYPVVVASTYASDGTLDVFRGAAIRTLRDRSSFLVVNYLRRTLKQESGGHISPVAAYHEAEDRFLILDVARYKYPPVWVKATDLWAAMAAVDPDSRTSRGYVIIGTQPSPGSPTQPAREPTGGSVRRP